LPPGVVADVPTWSPPWYEVIRAQVVQLVQQATALEQRTVSQSGEIVGHSAVDLVDAVLSDPMRLGPTVSDVRAWVVKTETQERARRRRAAELGTQWADPEGALTYTLRWQNGAIDASRSTVEPPTPPPPPYEPTMREVRPGEGWNTPRLNLAQVESDLDEIVIGGGGARGRTYHRPDLSGTP
jgi:hypothetical protein